MTFRTRLLLLFAAAAAVLIPVQMLHSQGPSYDILIRGGRIIDGTGNPWFTGDVAVKGGRIAAVGHLNSATAARVIDANGLVVAPGFIDLHTHSDIPLLADGTAQSKIRQGVTLDVIGEGQSVAPRDGLAPQTTDGVVNDWTTFTGYFNRIRKQGVSINVISHVSASQIHRVVMGYDDHAPSPEQMEKEKALMRRSMEEGAWGLVTQYESGGPEHPAEIIELAKIAAAYGGNYTSHIGSEGFEQTKEIAFAIRVADEAKIPVHIFHFKIRAEENWGTIGKYIAQIEAARALWA